MNSPTLPTPSVSELAALDRSALHARLHQRVEAAWELAQAVYPGLPRPPAWLDLRGKCAGQAHFGRSGLRFNPVLLGENRLAFLVEVVPHEMAHWLVHHLEGGEAMRPHGREWQGVMRGLYGLEPRATHRFDTRTASPAPHRYACACRSHYFSKRRHRLAHAGKHYVCRQCRQRLVWCTG
ncbi:SprT protein [Modicisalibacter ilicicola DSM 19980]|uniref:SprT protein n=1 Tax=Modicisalibacter ilicicola DSM 19980 TaxID=1121942 RepID=A0A1M4UMF7_9GAMM|nr:SprT-like domain-containing protein [Halomonas ilicicola]SHE57753.1 SprT protein [Halomonas ilicicola DSM 19980]